MSARLKPEVLRAFKALHRARFTVFEGDTRALEAARVKINDEFKQNKAVEQEEEIKKMISFALDVEKELRSSVVQAKEKRPGVYELKITEDTKKLDNVPFDPNVEIPKRGSKSKPCCQE